jgi:DNA-binding transcriptional ArsR family regulator
MVEYAISLDSVFSSLADPTRRDILMRVSRQELSVGEIAKPYSLSFAAISKHLKVLENAKLIIKQRKGKEKMIYASPLALNDAAEYLESYRIFWEERYSALDQLLKEIK